MKSFCWVWFLQIFECSTDYCIWPLNLVTLRKCNSHLQYYKIDLSFSIKLQEINLNICGEYKTERKARDPNRTELEARDENVPAKQADFFSFMHINKLLWSESIQSHEGCAISTANWLWLETLQKKSAFFYGFHKWAGVGQHKRSSRTGGGERNKVVEQAIRVLQVFLGCTSFPEVAMDDDIRWITIHLGT